MSDRRSSRPQSPLIERWTTIDGVRVFYRESRVGAEEQVMVHLHGFGLSGRYLLPTAERLAPHFHTYVPDLPGFGRSGRVPGNLDIPDLARAAPGLPRRSGDPAGQPGRQLDGLSGDL